MPEQQRLSRKFYTRDVLRVAPELLGKYLVLENNGQIERYIISEVEAYNGTEDRACHASKGRTGRTEVMFEEGGHLYIYLIYGIYYMLNIVTSVRDHPQAVLIRGLKEIPGPGRLTKKLGIDSSYNFESLVTSGRIWLEKGMEVKEFFTGPRIGIDYAGEPWISKQWRFYL